MPYYEQHDTDDAIAKKFRQLYKLKLSTATLNKYKPKTIHAAAQQYCVCHHCKEGQDAKQMLETLRNSIHSKCQQCSRNHECEAEKNLRDEKKEKLQDTLNQCENYKSHKRIANHQADAFSKAIQELKEGECLVVEDFAGRFIVKQDIKLSQRDFFARKGIPDLVLFCYYKKGDKTEKHIFDILAKKEEKEDFFYLRSAWLHLLNENTFFDQFQKIIVFSDGGPKHFKTRRSLCLFSLLDAKYPQDISWNFFQSCHGKVKKKKKQ